MRSFGVDGDDSAIDQLYTSLDTDNDGFVSLEELRIALTDLRDTSVATEKEAQRLKKDFEQLSGKAKAAQMELTRRLMADDADAMNQEQHEQVNADRNADRVRAASEAAAAIEARALAKKEEEEKAAYERRMRERQKLAAAKKGGGGGGL